MPLDLKTPWSDADLAKLLASVTDDRDWRLEVSKDGIADLSDKTANPTGDDYDETLHCYFETWMQGTDFVGPSAAADKALVRQDCDGIARELSHAEGREVRLRGLVAA
jgi:hypothetical protein